MPTALDFSTCDREQIQYAGAIQPHGALLVLHEPALRIVQASANTGDYLGLPPAALLGQGIERLLGDEATAALRARLASLDLCGMLLHLMSVGTTARNERFHLFGNRADGLLLLEFERLDEPARTGAPDLYQEVHSTLQRLQAAPSLQEFLQLAVAEIRALTGFDRVMAYRFAADGSGEVIAESVAANRETYLGLHYPAADIPEPARRLFALSWLRHLPDVDYVPIPLVSAPTAQPADPVDLSYSFLRSVSVMYTGYLKNMGVKATLVTTLLKDGRLWGLISCHHAAPRYLPYETRVAVECLAHMVSLLMGAKETEEHYAYRLRLGAARGQLLDALLKTEACDRALLDAGPELLTAPHADGAALLSEDRLRLWGHTPTEAEVRALADWLATRQDPHFVSHQLALDYPPAERFRAVASGLLAVRLSPAAPDGLLWFRRELLQTLHWAGDPHKPVTIDDHDDEVRLLPRTSFALWKETVGGQAHPWLDCEIEHANELRQGILEFIIGHTEQLRRKNTELVQSNLELDTFAYAASHDLKEPLRGIHSIVQFLQDDDGDRLSDDGRQRLATILRLTHRMDDLIESLLQYSRVGRIELDLQLVDLNAVLLQTLEDLQPLLKKNAVQVRVQEALPRLQCDHVRVAEVLSNLISNAVKYNDKADRQVTIGCDATLDPPVIFVRDNGIGIAPKQFGRIFQIFRRLHGRDAYGGGAGAGLTITRKAIERHGGSIWVESVPGEGSTFRFTLARPR
ncbi:ATP-binding protein [uncultured Thiodictyon sp.]|jgi:light-regulated signal transduction histidine kinase (bacteriophytochrome)|uniref:ATP-binding protein n=1 Tax=uncultured Thiodictyon sp. TaxID=1846217 RepID=UPI0025E69A34|nr:ATP-binding protein [uncultured Thiodictyon sp.]